jgi:hypothetical protein
LVQTFGNAEEILTKECLRKKFILAKEIQKYVNELENIEKKDGRNGGSVRGIREKRENECKENEEKEGEIIRMTG